MRPVILLGALVIAAGALFLYQAGLIPFGKDETPFAENSENPPASTGPGVEPPPMLLQNDAATPQTVAPAGQAVPAPQPASPSAQTAAPAATTPPAPAAPIGPVVDETALRYFAARGDTKRLETEIARLRALYPQWTPPENPMAAAPLGDPQLDQMWKLYSEGKTSEVRKAISDRQTREPAWQVPSDLLERLALAEARDQLLNASEIKQYEAVVRLASANPAMLTCADVDVLWRVAEAFASTDRMPRAVDAYLYILQNCEKPEERLATVQKAMLFLPRADIDKLLVAERTVNGKPEFEPVRGEIARRALVEADADPKILVSPADLALVEKLANEGGLVSDDLLLGWYHLGRSNPTLAEEWFRKARAKENSAASSQGLALALINQSRPDEAETILYEWRDATDEVRAVYLAAVANTFAMQPPPVLGAEVLQRAVAEIAAAKDATAAQQLGWYADGFNQFETAERWFQTALAWKPDDEPSAYGLALMRWKLGDRAGVREMQTAWTGRSERISTVGERSREPAAVGRRSPAETALLPRAPNRLPVRAAPRIAAPASGIERQDQAAAGSYAVDEPAAAPAAPRRGKGDRVGSSGCRTTNMRANLPPDAALAKGWCLMEANRPIEAAKAFEMALSGSRQTRSEAAYGQSLAYMRAGLTDMAAVSATKAPLTSSRSIEIRKALLASQANSAYQNGRYVEALIALDERARIAPEQNDLLVLRGYAYLNLVRYGDAERVFRAAASTGNRDAMRGLNDLWAARNPQSNPN
jgi:tetratricopeptide (TPR) repeat protein